MAGETLRTAAELLDLFPDNNTGLITAVAQRDVILSSVIGVGFVEYTGAGFTIPITQGTPVAVPPLFEPNSFAGNFWVANADNELSAEYPAGVAIVPGTVRLVNLAVNLFVAKQGTQPETYSLQATLDGVLVGNPRVFTLETTPASLALDGEALYDVTAAPAVGFVIDGVTGGDDVDVQAGSYRVTSTMI